MLRQILGRAALIAAAFAAVAIVLAAILGAAAIAPAHAAVAQVTGRGTLDGYSGQAYVSPAPFTGDPATLSTLSFQVGVQFREQPVLLGTESGWILHYGAYEANTLAADYSKTLSASPFVIANLSFAFEAPVITPNPELKVYAFLTPVGAGFAYDGSWITGTASVTALYDPPESVPEPPALLTIAAGLAGLALGKALRLSSRLLDSGNRISCHSEP